MIPGSVMAHLNKLDMLQYNKINIGMQRQILTVIESIYEDVTATGNIIATIAGMKMIANVILVLSISLGQNHFFF